MGTRDNLTITPHGLKYLRNQERYGQVRMIFVSLAGHPRRCGDASKRRSLGSVEVDWFEGHTRFKFLNYLASGTRGGVWQRARPLDNSCGGRTVRDEVALGVRHQFLADQNA